VRADHESVERRLPQLPHLRNDDGQTFAEYGVTLGVITPGVIIALAFLGDEVAAVFTRVGELAASLLGS
jgi:Flp pilus assembly pilin Flp